MAGVKSTLARLWRSSRPRPPARPPRDSRVGYPAVAVAGVGPAGEAVAMPGLESGEGGLALLLFLTSSCQGCRQFWDGLGDGPVLPGSPRVAIVTPGPELEDRRTVAKLAPATLPVVMSAEAWAAYDVTKAPFAVVARDGSVTGEGPLFGWEDLHGLLAQGAAPSSR